MPSYADLLETPLENLAQQAQTITRQYFGKAIGLYAPLYLANYCENACVYCGFHAGLNIPRTKLTSEHIEKECHSIAATGIQNILLLTGESRQQTPPEYLKTAVDIAKKYFPNIALEVYPLETTEYAMLYAAGVDGITIYQETYNRERYAELHPAGKKRDYDHRYNTPARIAAAGIRHISIGPLLGLTDWHTDIPAAFEHLRSLEKKYPGVEYSLSFPRIQKINEHNYQLVSDADMVRIMCIARILFPRIGINLSTRESAQFRDNVVPLVVTRMSAGSLTTVGGYAQQATDQSPQFSVNDERSLSEIKAMLEAKGFDPVLTDWRRI
jgi:2-iminoacetate synthase